MIKKLIYFVAGIAIIAGLMLLGVLAYIKPDKSLDLNYREVALAGKFNEILKTRKLEIRLSEEEVDHLLRKGLSQRPQVSADLAVTGARFSLNGNRLTADVNLLYRDLVPIGATLNFTLDWKDPYIAAEHTETRIKALNVPTRLFSIQPLEMRRTKTCPS